RPGWSGIFRHPMRRDARDKPGLKVRRGLNTSSDADADALAEQVKKLLHDRAWWSADRRADAERQGFAPQVISAFFDGIEAGHVDTPRLREAHIQLPGKDEGYTGARLA